MPCGSGVSALPDVSSPTRPAGARAAPGVLLPALGLSALVLGVLLPVVDPGHDAVEQAGSVARLAMHVAGVLTVGWLALTALVLDRSGGPLSPSQLCCLRPATVAALVWALAAGVVWALAALAALAASPSGPAQTPDAAGAAHVEVPASGRALLAVFAAAVLVTLAAPRLRTADAANALLVLAVAGVVLPVAVGHAGEAHGDPGAVVAVSLHVAAGSVWVGGLLALLALLRPARDVVEEALPRFSGLALLCVTVLTASGLVTARTRLDSLEAVTATGYGRLVVLKALLLAVCCVLGVLHRRTVLSRLPARGVTATFRRLATGELLVLMVALGVAGALSQAGIGH